MMAFVAVSLIGSRHTWMRNTKLIAAFTFMVIALIFQIINLFCDAIKFLRSRIAPIVIIAFHGISVVSALIASILLLIAILKKDNPETLCGPFQYSEVLIAAAFYAIGTVICAGTLILIIFLCPPPIDILSSIEKSLKQLGKDLQSRKKTAGDKRERSKNKNSSKSGSKSKSRSK